MEAGITQYLSPSISMLSLINVWCSDSLGRAGCELFSYKVFLKSILQKLVHTKICQLILCISNSKRQFGRFVGDLPSARDFKDFFCGIRTRRSLGKMRRSS